MNENVENLVLEQLRLIRADLSRMDGRIDGLASKIDDLSEGVDGVTTQLQGQSMLINMIAAYLKSVDERVEHLEKSIGGDAA